MVARLQEFLGNSITIDTATVNKNEPIATVSELAASSAAKSIEINKDNIASALLEAKEYNTCLIIVDNHTIVKITDLTDCIQSGGWATCMPKGTGYIQRKGALNKEEGYINNIIGIPDDKKRTLFLFDL